MRRGALGVRSQEGLEASAASPGRSFDGQDLYPDVARKAAALAFCIAKTYHPFLDGNKRAAAYACLVFCYTNGYRPQLTETELVAIIYLIADGTATHESLAEFLRDRMT